MYLLLTLVPGTSFGQTDLKKFSPADKFAAGISAGHYGYDPGVAAEITTPSFFKGHLQLRARGTLQWLEAYKSSNNHWARYRSYSLALVYHSRLYDRARFYVEAGTFTIVPDGSFSDRRFLQGVYEVTGLEVFVVNSAHYNIVFYVGIGPAFIEAYADRLEGTPRYGNGIHYMNGFRVYF